MWNGIPPPQMPPQPYQQSGMAPPVPGFQNRPKLEPIDWNLVAVLSPEIIRKTKDYDSLQRLVQIFMGAKLYQGSSRILAHPLCLRLCQLLQVAFEYLNFCQNELSSTNTKLESENQKLSEKVTKLTSKIKKQEEIIKIKSQPYNKCPVCEKKFKNLDYVDRHITNKHPELIDAWTIVRGRKQPTKEDNVQLILDKIDHLKNTLKKGSRKTSSKTVEQELMATEQELMDAEEIREQQEIKQNEEIRRQLFEAADELNSSMTIYNEQNRKKKRPKKTKEQMKIVNLFDPNAEVNTADFQNTEESPFNVENRAKDENRKFENFFNKQPNPFQQPRIRPSNDNEDNFNWDNQVNFDNNKTFNPFQNKANQFRLSIPPENSANYANSNANNANYVNNMNMNNNSNNINYLNNNSNNINYVNNNANNMNDANYMNNLNYDINNVNNLRFDDGLEASNNFGANQPVTNAGLNNNFALESMNNENVQVLPQACGQQNMKPISKQAISAAKKFISKQSRGNDQPRSVKATPENIDQVMSMIGAKVQDEIQRIGPNGVGSMMVRQKYGDNENPDYVRLRKQIQQKLEMEYPIDGSVNKVAKGFDLVHTEDMANIKAASENRVFDNNANEKSYNNENEKRDNIANEKRDNNANLIGSLDDPEFTSSFEFNDNKKKDSIPVNIPDEVSKPTLNAQNENQEKSPKKSPTQSPKKSPTKSPVKSPKKNQKNSPKSIKKQANNEEEEWSVLSSESDKTVNLSSSTRIEINSPLSPKEGSERHSISFDSSSAAKPKNTRSSKSSLDFIQSDMKPNLSDSPTMKSATKSSLSPEKSAVEKDEQTAKNSSGVKTPERREDNRTEAISMEIFNSPILSNSSSKAKNSASPTIQLVDDIIEEEEEEVDSLSQIDKMFAKSENLSENTSNDQSVQNSTKIEPLSDDEFNFPPVATDSFLSSSDEDHEKVTKKNIREKNSPSQSPTGSNSHSNMNSNLVDKESDSNFASISKHSETGSKSRMSVLSSAIRIERAEDTNAVFQNIDDTNSPSVEPVISRRKRNSPSINKGKVSHPAKNVVIDDISDNDEDSEEAENRRKFNEYKKIADEKFRKEFDFDFDLDDSKQPDQNKDSKIADSFDEFELTGKSNESEINEDESQVDSDDESGFANPPPRFNYNLKAIDDDNENPVKEVISDRSENKSGIVIVSKTNKKYGQKYRLLDDSVIQNSTKSNLNDDDYIVNNNNSNVKSESRKRILKQTGIKMISKTNSKFGSQRRNEFNSDSDSDVLDQKRTEKKTRQFNEENDKRNQFLRDSRNISTNNNDDDSNDYGYVSDNEDEIKDLPKPEYFDRNDDFKKMKPESIRKKKEENSLFSSPLLPESPVSSSSVYQPENERLTFYEKRKKSSKTIKSGFKKKEDKKIDMYEFTNAEPSLMGDGEMHSDDF